MLKRARIFLLAALGMATMGFTGQPELLAPLALILFYFLTGFGVLSLLFALFEDAEVPRPRVEPHPKTGATASEVIRIAP